LTCSSSVLSMSYVSMDKCYDAVVHHGFIVSMHLVGQNTLTNTPGNQNLVRTVLLKAKSLRNLACTGSG
jgi:hypothetical protein